MSQLEVKREKNSSGVLSSKLWTAIYCITVFTYFLDQGSMYVYCITRCTDPHLIYAMFLYFQEILRDTTVADSCTPQHLGLLLIYHLQVKIQDKI